MAEEPYKYWAFISYSHRDRVWADWLHRALERYRVPRRLVGREGPVGAIPRRLFPVFRDTEELPSSPNLSGVIDEALRQSRYLIVIASPYAAVSRWVDEEILRFRALGRADRILCLIVDGEPHAETLPDKGLLECFPPSLRAAGSAEPVGADLRPRKDSKASAKLRLIAGVLGVGLDELRRRERRRRLLQSVAWSVVAAIGLIALGGFWKAQQAAKQAALAQQALQTHVQSFYEKGRQELQARNEARAAVYLNEAYRLGLDTPALRFMLGRAMRVVDSEETSINVGAPVISVAFSPDAERIFTLDQERHAAIWNRLSRKKLASFKVPDNTFQIGSFASFSHDGSKIQTLVGDRERPRLIVFDTSNGQVLVELEIERNAFQTQTKFDLSGRFLAFVQPDGRAAVYDFVAGRVVRSFERDCALAGYSRDGRWLISGDSLGVTRIYDPHTGRLLRSFDSLGAPVVYVDTSPDGALLAAGAQNGKFRLWEAATGKIRISAAHASRYIGHVFNSVDGSRLLTASIDSARVWDTRSGALLDSIKFASNAERIHISADGRRLINTGNARLKVIDVDSGAELFSLDAHFGGATDIDFSSDDRWLATAGRDGTVAFWQLPRMPMARFEHGSGAEDPSSPGLLMHVSSGFDRSGLHGFSGGGDGRVEVWDAESLQPLRQLTTAVGTVTAIAVGADGARLAVGGFGALQVWDLASGALATDIRELGKPVREVKFSADGRIVAGALRGGEARLWQLPSGRVLKILPIDRYLAQDFSPNSSRYVIGKDGAVSLWDLERNVPLWLTRLGKSDSPDPIAVLHFSRDASRVLAVSNGGDINLLDAGDGRVLQHARDETSESVTTAVFAPDEHSILLSDDNRCAFLLRLADLASRQLCGHGMDLASAGFSRDGSLIFTASRDGTAKIWSTDGSLLDTVGFHSGAIAYRTTSFNQTGDRLLTGSEDGSARVWDTTPETRTPQQVQASLQCRVPWRPDGDDIVPVRPDMARCGQP